MRTQQTIPSPLQYNWHFCDWHIRQTQRRDSRLFDWPLITERPMPDNRFGASPLSFSYHLTLARGEYPSYERADS